MTNRKFFKTVFRVTVLSEDAPIEEPISLEDLEYAINEGPCSGVVERVSVENLDSKQAATALISQGTEPEFFLIDKDGNDLEDDQAGSIHKVLGKDEEGVHCIHCARPLKAGEKVQENEDGSYEHDAGEGAPCPPTVVCGQCGNACLATTAHLHQGRYVGDECCWDERLRSSE